jgi:SAM-dependent methyltransferase
MKNLDTQDAKSLHQNRQKMYDEAGKYRSSFVDPATGLISGKYVENRLCPVCGSAEHRFLFVKNGGSYVACNDCSMIFLNPVFNDDDLIEYYQNNTAVQALAHASEDDFYRKIYGVGLEAITGVRESGTVLDIGCSSGLFLDIAKEKGFQTYGIELNKTEVAIARSKGHVIWDVPIQDLRLEPTFDIITLWDVFEHIKDGVAYLTNLKHWLSKNGVLFMQIPNANSLAPRIMRDKCNMFDGLEHVNLYSPNTISAVAASAGYRVQSIFSVIDELKPIKNFLSYEDPYRGSFSAKDEFDFLVPEIIHAKLLGYKLQVVLTIHAR